MTLYYKWYQVVVACVMSFHIMVDPLVMLQQRLRYCTQSNPTEYKTQ